MRPSIFYSFEGGNKYMLKFSSNVTLFEVKLEFDSRPLNPACDTRLPFSSVLKNTHRRKQNGTSCLFWKEQQTEATDNTQKILEDFVKFGIKCLPLSPSSRDVKWWIGFYEPP